MFNRQALILLPLASLFLAGRISAQDEGFFGSWKAEHDGRTYLVMTIAAGSPLKISIATAVITVDEKSGEISKVEGSVEHNETVLEAHVDSGRLRIKVRQDDADVVEYEMRLEGKTAAALTILGAPSNIKPFRLQRSNH
jgi:hypothetical protein